VRLAVDLLAFYASVLILAAAVACQHARHRKRVRTLGGDETQSGQARDTHPVQRGVSLPAVHESKRGVQDAPRP